MSGYFISGTDTGVGKTLVTGSIARALVQSGKKVGVLKPCETGCRIQGDGLVPADAVFLQDMSGCREDIDTVCPYKMQHPLAPWVAATLENVEISVARIASICREMLERYDVVLVEGAGGLMVPITENMLTLDVIKLLNLPLIIVARLSLGTINHTLLSVKQAQSSGIKVAGIILNQLLPDTSKAEETNPQVIKRFSEVRLLGQMPFIAPDKRNDSDYLANLATQHINLSHFLNL